MSKKDLLNGMRVKVAGPSDDNNVKAQQADPSVFYRCRCPKCGHDALQLRGFGMFDQFPLMGVTGKGSMGLGYVHLDRDCERMIECRECGYGAFLEGRPQANSLLGWARSHGEEIKALEFTCPVCGNNDLYQVATEVEIHCGIAAVYEGVWGSMPGTQPMVALTGERLVLGDSFPGYRCANGHDLDKDDGSPVENAQELVVWLKANQASNKG